MFTGIGLIAFCCIFGAALIGFALGIVLPHDHRTDATQKVVQTTMNVVALLAALVLGLLVAATKGNFDTRSREVEQFATTLTLLDRELMHFGAGASEMRADLRAYTARKIALAWPAERGRAPVMEDLEAMHLIDGVEDRL